MTTRRLAAIAVLDVVGYSKMMADDEEGTLATLKAHRNEVEPILLNHGARIVKGTGDGLLVEVPSVIDAVKAAVATQQLMASRNSTLPAGRAMELRIGINLGDIIIDDDGDVYGDGVNLAARLETLAEPGGICVSGSVHDQVHGRVEVSFEDLGPMTVKNIPEPVQAWKAVLDDRPSVMPAAESSEVVATVAVLPFDNMSEDPEQDYLADGITDDLITALATNLDFQGVRIVARNSTFAYKGRSLDVRRIARELDATHVVEGSVRRAGSRVRVTAQLIESESGHHIWAERYDRDMADVFELQDEIVQEIANHIHPAIVRAQGEKQAKRSPDELGAWDLLLRARWHVDTNTRRDGLEEGIHLAELALERDPSLALAHAELARWWLLAAFNRWQLNGKNSWAEMKRHANVGYQLDPSDLRCMVVHGWAELYSGHIEEAAELARRARAQSPQASLSSFFAGAVALFEGDTEPAVEYLSEAWHMTRHEPFRFHIATNLAFAHYLAHRYDAALAWAEQGLDVSDYLQLRAVAAAALGQLGQVDDATRHLRHVTRERPGLTATEFGRNMGWVNQSDIDHYFDGLVKAGLPR